MFDSWIENHQKSSDVIYGRSLSLTKRWQKSEIHYTHSKFCAPCAMQKDFHQVLNIRMMERNGYAVQKNSHSMRFDDMTLYKVIDDLMLD